MSSELEDAKEFGKYLLKLKEKNQNFFFELELEDDQSIKLAFWVDARSRAACEYFGDDQGRSRAAIPFSIAPRHRHALLLPQWSLSRKPSLDSESSVFVSIGTVSTGFMNFAKGVGGGGKRLVVLDEMYKRDILIPTAGGASITIRGVSEDIRCDKGDRIRFKSDVLEFNQMSELLNQKSAVQGKIPSGYFNALFDLSGNWLRDAADIKYLAIDGYFISLDYLHLTASPLVLQEEVKKSVPAQWDLATLAR
ncbi:MACPF domain-containing protein NSL1-like [Arachis ipaensis]|uniref:MACPF domain-containing protein NSL1-like n=1 Tax=Arachis ipaensis TaxID=130454 RepID=UPI000A2B1D03|nr:MACPF domain-containing protein NSL1-like [Arachis ipaensis]